MFRPFSARHWRTGEERQVLKEEKREKDTIVCLKVRPKEFPTKKDEHSLVISWSWSWSWLSWRNNGL